MANDLRFSVQIDLEQAIKEASGNADKYLRRLQDAFNKRAINVRVNLGGGTQVSSTELVGFKKQLAELTKEWNKLTAAERGGAEGAALRERYRALQREAQGYVSTLRAAVTQEDKLAAARDKAARAAECGTTVTRNANREFHNQDGYISRLIKRLAVYAGFQQITGFLRNVREVTAQFELQRVSLGAIIQDQTRANALFSEIKQFALKSPISIMDLTKYTKQVAAYKIETDKLFDTTKRLADVSVGLGVDMGRLVLAYGQVKAASYLRAAEIRQFTEAGIPMLELLAEKFTKLNGEAVTTEQVMEMVSKRMVGFEMVEDIFNDMTSAGGMFYNMQEKQGNTLFGLWAKLGDAASVMYDEIGNTETVNSGMKSAIEALTDLMRNWERTARAMGAIGLVIAGLIVKKKILALEIAKVDAIQRTYNARMIKANALASSNSRLIRAQGVAMGVYATAMRTASTTAAAFGTSLQAIKSALVTTGWGALLVALGYIVDKLFLTQSAAEKAAEAIDKIASETVTEQNKSVRNFEYLANAAVNAADGSRKQREALDELQRTYKDILPSEVLELEYLKKLKGDYDSLTMSIRQYVAEQQRRKMLDEISNVYGTEKLKYEKKLTDFFESEGWSEQEIARFWEHFYSIAGDKSKSLEQVVSESMRKAGRDGIADAMKLLKNQRSLTKGIDKDSYKAIGLTVVGRVDYIDMLRDAVLEENKALERSEERSKAAAAATNAFAEAQEKSAERVKNATIKMDGNSVDRDSYIGDQAIKNLQIKELTNNLKDGFEQAGLEWDANFGNFIDRINASKPELISSLNFDAIINSITEALKNPKLTDEQRNFLTNLLSFAQQSKEAYAEIVPSDPVVRTWQQRFKQIAQAAGGFRKEYNQYLIKAGEDLKTYNGRLKSSLEGLKNNVKGLLATQKLVVKAGIFAKLFYGVSADELQKKIDEANKEIEIIENTLAEQPNFDNTSNRSGGTRSDNRLQNLKEEISLVQKLYNEYKQLEKQEGASKAAEDMRRMAGTTIDMFKKKYGFDLPTDAKDLTSALEILYKKMAALPKKTFAQLDKELKEFRWTIEKVNIDDSQKKIEAQLKQLSDRISRTKTAREFYDKVMGMTGDYELAGKVAMSIYGSDGNDLKQQLAKQIRELTNDLELPDGIISADNIVDYKALRKWAELNKDELGKTYDELVKIAEQGQKDLAKTYEGYFKDLEKAKTYASQRIELAQTTANKIRQIRADMASGQTDKAVGENLISGLIDKEMKEAAKLEWDAFKGTPLYTQMFEDLEHASTSTLEMMRSRLEALSRTWGSALDPTQLKEMQSRMNEITDQLRDRNPWKQLQEAYRQYKDATDSVTLTGAATKAGEASKNYYDTSVAYGADSVQAKAALQELQAREKIVDIIKQITAEQGKQVKGQKALTLAQQKAFDNEKIARGHLEIAAAELKKAEDKAIAEGKDPTKDPEVKAKREVLKLAMEQLDIAELVSNILAKLGEDIAERRKSIASAANGIKQGLQIGADLAKGIADTMEALGGNEDDVQYWNDISTAIGDITAGVQGLIDSVLSLNVGGIISNAIGIIPNMVKGFAGLFSAGKVRKANKEIKRQQELLEQLEYSYGRLQDASDKLFGRDYINNYNQQIKNLEAQQQAYLKQAEAERSKGKKADEEKIKEYENQARDTADELKKLQEDFVSQIVGTDVASAARDFAQAWLDAYLSFSSTTDAIKGKFDDMIKNMIVNMVLAQVVKSALQPIFNMIDELAKDGELSADDIATVMQQVPATMTQINDGLSVGIKGLEQAGFDISKLRDGSEEFSGIAKNVASASSEEINANTAALNTQNFYMGQIHADVAAMRALMEGGSSASMPAASAAGWTDWQQQAMDSYVAIQRNTADAVVECRRIAIACEEEVAQLRRVIVPRGTKGSHGVQVYM